MKEKNRTKIIVALISALAAGTGGTFIGNNFAIMKQEEYFNSQIVEINGNNNNVEINSVKELIDQYLKLLDENDILKEKNTDYFNELSSAKTEIEYLEAESEEVPELSFADIGLVIDAEDVSINKSKSMVIIEGRKYFSDEILERIVPNDETMTIKDGNLFVGKVISEKAKLSDQWIVNDSGCCTDSVRKDSYGNTRTATVLFTYYKGSIVYNLNRKYSYLKCTISICEDYSMNSNVTLMISSDVGELYSVQLEKTTEPYEVEIPINSCSLLTISVNTLSTSSSVIISDAILYN